MNFIGIKIETILHDENWKGKTKQSEFHHFINDTTIVNTANLCNCLIISQLKSRKNHQFFIVVCDMLHNVYKFRLTVLKLNNIDKFLNK